MLKNLKKVISTIAAVAILASSAAAFAVDFPDVDETAKYAGAVELLTGLGIVDGDENGKFNPDNTVTRAEFAKMVVEAKGKGDVAASSTYSSFADVQGHWAAGYIEAGVGDGFINGYDEKTFGPNDTVTYAQAVKMLVGAVGYEPWAEEVGGWPAGYLAYGSTLNIVNGVTGVTNDTALTRAQCAVLIANAVKAPLLEVMSYQHVGTMNGTVLVPVYGQRNNEDYTWESLLTKHHNAYEVFGRVTATSKNGAKRGEVIYAVENSENIDKVYVENGTWSDGKNDQNYAPNAVLINGTNAEALLFEYTNAVIAKDEDTDEFRFVTIEKYGTSEMVEVAAKTVVDINAAAMLVQKSEASTATKTYKVDAPAVYVNGYQLDEKYKLSAKDEDGNGKLDDYIVDADVYTQAKSFMGANNATGVVTLIDKTNTGSTLTDGKYDLVMINYTESAIVEFTRTKSDGWNEIVTNLGKITWDSEDEDVVVTFTKDGEEIAFSDLAEDDVLTITMMPDDANPAKPASGLAGVTALSVEVTNETVSGVVSRFDNIGKEVVVDGTEYTFLSNTGLDAKSVTKEYTLFLDANGAVVKAELIAANINYGIITKVKYSDVDDEYRVYMITADGSKVSYEFKDGEFDKVADLLSGKDVTVTDDSFAWTLSKASDIATATVQYRLSSGKFVMGEKVAVIDGTAKDGLEFSAARSKLGGYSIADTTTKIVDLSAFLKDSDDDAVAMTVESFEDEIEYKSYIFDKNDNGNYQFVVVVEGTNSLRATSPLAMVKAYAGATVVNEENVQEYVVIRNGEEEALYVSENAKSLDEGDVIMYPTSAKGYVKAADIKKVAAAGATYDAMMTKVLAANTSIAAEYASFNSTITGLPNATDVKTYVGLAYTSDRDNLSLVTDLTSGVAEVAKAKDLSVDGANVFSYNFRLTADKGYRVEDSTPIVTQALFSTIFTDDSKNFVDFNKAAGEQVYPVITFVREIENDVTDVIYFTWE